jgi:gluconolactonase
VSAQPRDARFAAIVGSAPLPETLADGFGFTEGPLWDARGARLLFSDIPGNRIMQWSRMGTAVFRAPSQMSNGLTWDREGRLLACEHATSRVTRTEADGSVKVLAAAFEGKELNSPNDIVVKSDGAIYFTDPVYGRAEYYGVPRKPQLSVRGLYRLAPTGGQLSQLASDFGQPNGLCLSADERRLFVNDTERGHIRVFDVRPDGGVTGGGVWSKVEGEGPGAPDGMKFDSAGNLYCCGPGGIHVFAADAGKLGVIDVPGGAANFTWGDDDLRSLFITAGSRLCRLRVQVPGRAG